jgi:MFS transporter, ACS family, tartrate transporter
MSTNINFLSNRDLGRKITLRVTALLGLGWVVAILDRANISFAALSMNRDLGFSSTVFGWGAGMFFVGYLLCEVPSTRLLSRYGARRWIARIMITWGLVSAALAAVNSTTSYYVLRFLLGAAEAGFLPGVIYYFKAWFPTQYRVRMIALFMSFVPVTTMFAAPLSVALLKLDGMAGLHGWQWLLMLEGVPSVILGFFILKRLPDRIDDAHWLTSPEKAELHAVIAEDALEQDGDAIPSAKDILRSFRPYFLGVLNFAVVICIYALLFWLPQIVAGFKWEGGSVALAVAVVNAFGAVGMLVWGKTCRNQEQQAAWNIGIPCVIGAAGLLAAAGLGEQSPLATIAAFSVASLGLYAALPPFWNLAGSAFKGEAAATGLAFVNTIGSMSGVLGPPLIGYIKDRTHSFELGIAAMAAILVVVLLLLAVFRSKLYPKPLRLGAVQA